MSLGEVDTLNLLTERLDTLFNESQGYYESFLDANTLYKNGKMTDKEFFQKLGDYTVAYSALEFLSIKVIMELKKAIDRMAGGKAPGGTHAPTLMPGVGQTSMPGVPPDMPRLGTADNPVGGAPPGIVSPNFSQTGTLPAPDPSVIPRSESSCPACRQELRPNAKFCTKCGTKV